MELTEVKGIGPATAIKLKTAGINTAEDLANSSIDDLIAAGIGKTTAAKIVNNAKEVVGTSSDKPKVEEKSQKAPKKTSKKPTAKEDKPTEVKPVKIPISYVKGVGPKTKKILEEGKIIYAKDLASSSVEQLTELGIGKSTAEKIIKNAVEQIKALPEDKSKSQKKGKVEEQPVEKPEKVDKAKPDKKKPTKPAAEHERSPAPQGIPTKKKRGVQIRKTDLDESEGEVLKVEKAEGWGVKAKELSKEEIARRKARQEEIARSRQITRPIPQKPEPIKAVKAETKIKGEKPERVERKKKKVKLVKKIDRGIVEYYSLDDLKMDISAPTRRGIRGKAGTSKPRITLERDTRLGRITSHRRSRRVINEKQLIVKLENGHSPDQLMGQKVYFKYPETSEKIPGSVSKRFGKASSGKVLVNFRKGIRREALNQSIFIK